MKKFSLFLTIMVGVLILLQACASSGNKSGPLSVTILHINDHHSHLEPINYDLTLGGDSTRVPLGGFAQLATVIKEQETVSQNPIVLHAGDALTGTIYYSLFKGKSDAEVMNTISWDAFVLGNHEFDGGNETLKDFLDELDAPTVAANVVPDKGSILQDTWTPYRIIEVEGQKIGIIGIDIVGKTVGSSSPGPDIKFFDEFETTKKYVDELTKKRINKIFVLTHIGHKNALELARSVAGVDVIITGDSHTLLDGEEIKQVSLNPEGEYPTMVTSPTKEPVAIIQAWEYTKLLGKLEVNFDENGVITSTTGSPMIIVSDSFKRKNAEGKRVELEGADRDAVYKDIAANKALVLVKEPDAEVLAIVNKYKEEKDIEGKKVVGSVLEEIPGGSAVRIPSVENGGGSFMAQLVAEASYASLKAAGQGHVDVFLQNAGGVRIPLVPGDINMELVKTILPFSNTIETIEITGAEIKLALEQSIDYALNPQGSTGSFPYTAGMRFTADLKAKMGSRVSEIQIEKNGSWTAIDPAATYTLAMNNYVASGKDGYIVLGEIDPSKKVDTYIEDTQVLVDYIRSVQRIKKPSTTSVKLK